MSLDQNTDHSTKLEDVNSVPGGRSRPRSSARPRLRVHGPRHLLFILLAVGFAWFLPLMIGWPSKPLTASAASDPVIAAAGDIACDPADASYNSGLGTSTRCRQKYTSDLLVNGGLAAVLDLGDNQYYCGSLQAYQAVYDATWGRVKGITLPVPGNHEYLTSGGTGCDSTNAGAAGYFNYFGSVAGSPGKGYYSYDIGAWHIIALNSNCSNVGGCGSTSAQYKWLQSDLAAHPNSCTLAYWHIPLFSSGTHAASNSKPFWQLLYSYNADVILNGHDHLYERFAPQDPNGVADPVNGIRQFTVGTGGSNHNSVSTVAANSQIYNTSTFGVLRLTLHSSSYDWSFQPESGKTFTDSGTTPCHGAPAPTPTSTGSTVTFGDTADTYVSASYPSTNYGTLTTLRTDGSPDVHSYLKFSVSGLNGKPIARARLVVYANSSSSVGINAWSVASTSWSETTMTYSNAPALGSNIAGSGAITAGTWVSLDVTSYVKAEGTYSLGLTTPGSTALSFQSKEASANKPQLILDLGTAASTATPTATPGTVATSTPSPTPTAGGVTATPTNTPVNTPTSTPTSTAVSATNTPTATPSSSSLTFVPGADSYVNSSYPSTNFGTLTALRADGSPDVHSYVRFAVQGLNGQSIQSAQLRFYMNSSGSAGLAAEAVSDNTWTETGITYNNAPPLGASLGATGGVTSGTWVTIDVTGYVTAEGTYNFGVTTPGSTALSFASRESGANSPQLIINLAP